MFALNPSHGENQFLKAIAMLKDILPPHRTDDTITATGIVIPAEWDENGIPTAFAIATTEEEEYLIDEQNEAGRKVKQFIRQKVRVTGMIGNQAHRLKKITVSTCVVISPD